MHLEVMKCWPDWKATRLIGEGSFGKVYEIVRSNFGIEEHCALKVISIPSSDAELQSMRSEGMDDASVTEYYRGLVEEFVQEIALMSKLKGNVNIVGYEDYAVLEHEDSIGWDIIIRMELLTPLPTYIKENSFTANDVIKLAMDVCNALDVCHGQKVLHRDIKPDNIFVSQNGDYKLGDFGVARTIEKTVSGLSKKGTYTYMAPEVYKGGTYGTNVDLYSLGMVMYRLLNNNREPFLPPHPELIKYSDKNNALVRRMSGEQIPPPANSNEVLNRIILKACNFISWERYQLPAQMKADLQNARVAMNTEVQVELHAEATPSNNSSQMGQMERFSQSFSAEKSSTGGKVYVFDTPKQATNTPVQVTNTPVQVTNTPVQPMNGINSLSTCEVDVPEEPNKLRKIATIIGWAGVSFWTLVLIASAVIVFVVLSLFTIACMIFLTIKKQASATKVFSIIMLVFSACTFNIFGVAASILFLCSNKAK